MFTLTDGYLTLIPGIVVLIPAVPVAVWLLQRRSDPGWTLLALLALVHVTLVVALTIFPVPIGGQDYYRHTRAFPAEDNVVPFATIAGQIQHLSWNNIRQLTGNLLALAPFGIYGPGLWPVLRDWRRFLLAAVAFGVAIELTQLLGSLLEGFTYRVTDVDDAIMNAAGAMAAFAVWRWLGERAWARDLAARALDSPPLRPKI
jgi:glycopeptide antibiotics resistance protein